jgi:uncharacterized protein YlxP (DUF503 family)
VVVAALRFEIRIPDAQSLKAKRSVLRPLVEGLRQVGSVSISEVDHQDTWQRSAVGVAMVTPDPASMESLVNRVRNYVSNRIDVEVLSCAVTYLETDE